LSKQELRYEAADLVQRLKQQQTVFGKTLFFKRTRQT